MKKLIPFFLAFIIAACGGGANPDDPLQNVAIKNPNDLIAVQTIIPYAEGSRISKKIKLECTGLQTKLSGYIRDYGASNGVGVVLKPKVSKNDKGKVLVVRITEAWSEGNAFIGHRKSTAISGEYYDNGKQVADFKGLRVSGGGFFGGFKGSCSVMGRTVKALGSDVGSWLAKPTPGAQLGDY